MKKCSKCGTDQDVALYEWLGIESGLFLCSPCMHTINKDYDPISQSFKGSKHYNEYHKIKHETK